jgi:CRP/FNR family cyclic AMP-dependent transcriptional regulator
MISPELLRRFAFFGLIGEQDLYQIAMIAEEVTADTGTVLFEECQPAEALYLLLEGSIDLYQKSEEEYHPKGRKEFLVGEINPGEIFSISSLLEPYVLNASARASKPSGFLIFEAAALRRLGDQNPQLGYVLMRQVAKALMERLAYTRVQLAAAWA